MPLIDLLLTLRYRVSLNKSGTPLPFPVKRFGRSCEAIRRACRRHIFLALLVLISLPACTTVQVPVFTPAEGWQQHQSAIQTIESWHLQGRLAIRTAQESNTVSINWWQDNQNFEITLSGLLGLGAVNISGNNRIVILEKAGEEPVLAASLEDIGQDYLGYEFPASELYYWIRGIPDPSANNQILVNADQRLASLSQNDWQMEYDRYQEVSLFVLPGRIRLEHGPYRLTFLINSWEIDSP